MPKCRVKIELRDDCDGFDEVRACFEHLPRILVVDGRVHVVVQKGPRRKAGHQQDLKEFAPVHRLRAKLTQHQTLTHRLRTKITRGSAGNKCTRAYLPTQGIAPFSLAV